MGLIWTPQTRIRLPSTVVGIAKSNPIAQRLCAVAYAHNGGMVADAGLPRPIERFARFSASDGKIKPSILGLGVDGSTATTTSLRLEAVANTTTSAWAMPVTTATWFAWVVRYGNEVGNAPIFGNTTATASPYSVYSIVDGGGTGTTRLECSAGGSYRSLDMSTMSNGKPYFIVGRYNGSKLEGFINGAKSGSSTTCSGNLTYPAVSDRGAAVGNFWNYLGANRSFNGAVALVGLSPYALTDAEIIRLSANPAQVLAPDDVPIWLTDAGSSGVTGTAAVTEAADTAAASGTITHLGTAAVTAADDTAAAIGYLSHLGTAAITEGADVAAAIGTVGSGEVIGTATITEAGDIAAASGYLSHLATAAITEGADVAAASGTAGDPLYGFTQNQLDFLVAHMTANLGFPSAADVAAAVWAKTLP